MRLKADFSLTLSGFNLNVALNCEEGVTAITGPSGAGKTTALRAIAGLLKPRQGCIRLGGRVLFDAEERINLSPERRKIGLVEQRPLLFPHLNVGHNIIFGWKRTKSRFTERELKDLIDMLDLGPLTRREISGLSGGEQQRVSMARALVLRPELLLLDEPFAAQDMARRRDITRYLREIESLSGIPILIVSHDWGDIARIASRVVLMEAGQCVYAGTVNEGLAYHKEGPPGSQLMGQAVGDSLLFDLEGGALEIPIAGPVSDSDKPVRVFLSADDVILAPEKPGPLSANFVARGQITAVQSSEGGSVLVRVTSGPQTLMARLTVASSRRLDLQVGAPVYAVVKSAAFTRL